MKRRIFLKSAALSAVAVSATGFIKLDGDRYIGDCETTSDILGPFYRPNGPVRSNLRISGEKGEFVELLGKIKQQDCTTPYKNAKIELWHCGADGVYDNSSSEYRYRGTTFSNENGDYSFQTILPVAYDAGGGEIRPAHFHMMITAEGYQPLVTQLYFNGDKYIEKDAYANSDFAKKRRLDICNSKEGKKVNYDVSMTKIIPASAAAIDSLTGVYVLESDKNKKVEFFKHNNTLWLKNEVFGEEYRYIGNNKFESAGMPKDQYENFTFEILGSGAVKCTMEFAYEKNKKGSKVYRKV